MDILSETPVQGDEITLQHGLEITAQTLNIMLVSDLVFSHSVMGLSNDYRHGQHTCTYCEVSKQQLQTQ